MGQSYHVHIQCTLIQPYQCLQLKALCNNIYNIMIIIPSYIHPQKLIICTFAFEVQRAWEVGGTPSSSFHQHGGHGHPSPSYHQIGSYAYIHLVHPYSYPSYLSQCLRTPTAPRSHVSDCLSTSQVSIVLTYHLLCPSYLSYHHFHSVHGMSADFLSTPQVPIVFTYHHHITSTSPGGGILNWITLLSPCEMIIVKGMIHRVRVPLFLPLGSQQLMTHTLVYSTSLYA